MAAYQLYGVAATDDYGVRTAQRRHECRRLPLLCIASFGGVPTPPNLRPFSRAGSARSRYWWRIQKQAEHVFQLTLEDKARNRAFWAKSEFATSIVTG